MRLIFEEILQNGESVTPSKGANREVIGACLELTNPRARLSSTETRGKLFSSLGELCWYLSGTAETDFICYYIKAYRRCDEGGRIFGGYGPRLFNWKGMDQIANVRALLRDKSSTRRAVIQLFDAGDLSAPHEDVPCTCTLQFLLRSDRLHLVTYMRSNDALVGLPHDIFCFTMLQELIARDLGVEVGTYKHMVGSLHIYEIPRPGDPDGPTGLELARQFIREGWQSTLDPMPAMPVGDPWPAIHVLVAAEKQLRSNGTFTDVKLEALDPYWADLIRLLQVYRCNQDKNTEAIRAARDQINSSLYCRFIDRFTTQA